MLTAAIVNYKEVRISISKIVKQSIEPTNQSMAFNFQAIKSSYIIALILTTTTTAKIDKTDER